MDIAASDDEEVSVFCDVFICNHCATSHIGTCICLFVSFLLKFGFDSSLVQWLPVIRAVFYLQGGLSLGIGALVMRINGE